VATLAPDRTLTEQAFTRGIVRDTARHQIPPGGVYDAVDFLLEQPGKAYKRGGWERHSARLGSETTISMVATIHIPTRVVAIANGTLYDVTSESVAQADSIGACAAPRENPPQYLDRLIVCDGLGVTAPKKVYWNSGGGGTIAVAALGGSPPTAIFSTVYGSRIVLGRSLLNLNRLWFSPVPDVEDTWDTDNAYLDVTYEVTGLAAVQGVLLIFSPNAVERILGAVPPGTEGENMQLQPAAGVGCTDARTIAHWNGEIIFAGEEGVWATNGAGARSLLEKPDGTGIQSYWRSLFVAGAVREMCGGLLGQDFYLLSLFGGSDVPVATLLCHLPTLAWTRLSNMAYRMLAVGRTENETLELYGGSLVEGYVHRLRPILKPVWANRADGNATTVTPTMTLRPFAAGPGLKAYGFGHLTYDMRADSGSPTLAAATAPGIGAPTFTSRLSAPKTTAVARKRFNGNKDSEALSVKLTQSGASASTEVYAVEVEARGYDTPSEVA
jgi:hypothetical protein